MREMIGMLDGLSSFQVEPGNGANYVGGAAYPDEGGFPTLVSGRYGLAGFQVEPADGSNYVGGGAYPDEGGFPTLISGEYGLAGPLASYLQAFAGGSSKHTSVEPGNGALYTGGAAYPDEGGFPTLVSGSYGLAGLRRARVRAGLRGALDAGATKAQAVRLARRVATWSPPTLPANMEAHIYWAAFFTAAGMGKSKDAARKIAYNAVDAYRGSANL